MEPFSEEGAARHIPCSGQPKGRRKWEQAVAGSQVRTEMLEWVVPELVSANDNPVALEVSIGFMVGKQELIEIEVEYDGGSFCDFSPVAKGLVIREG